MNNKFFVVILVILFLVLVVSGCTKVRTGDSGAETTGQVIDDQFSKSIKDFADILGEFDDTEETLGDFSTEDETIPSAG